MNNTEVNIVFNRGVNVCLVLHSTASICNFDVVSSKTNDLSTACNGKSTLKSEFSSDLGVDSLSLLLMIFWGAPYITVGCSKYSTGIIKGELYRNFPQYRNEILPPYFGGAAADILVGGEEIGLIPKSLCSLMELGVNLYCSPLTDIFGSSIIFSVSSQFLKGVSSSSEARDFSLLLFSNSVLNLRMTLWSASIMMSVMMLLQLMKPHLSLISLE